LGPQKFLELKIFFSLGENRVPVRILLIKDSVVNDFIKNALASCPVLNHKVLMALIRADNKVHKYANLIPQAFVVFLMTLLHDFVELRLEARNGFGVACQVCDSDLATDLN